MRTDIQIAVPGGTLAAWHYAPSGETFAGSSGLPCVVMAHGFAATRDSGLEGFAERFAAAGLHVLAFDYRGFGESIGGTPGTVSPAAQVADYRGAVAFARSLAGVDPDRIVVWGVSLSGGHVFPVAAADPRIAGAIALTPAVDGPVAMRGAVGNLGAAATGVSAAVAADLVAAARGGTPVTLPVVAEPGAVGVMTAPGAAAEYRRIAGPTWTNRVPARSAAAVGAYRPGRRAKDVRCPMLVQIADEDQSAPPAPARRAAFRARADVRHYPCDHFDVYPGSEWFEQAVAHQLHFLHRHFAPGSEFAPVVPVMVNA
ncbi:alpha/beta fold hydrolase [Pseudonocardia sp. NPDC049154]|uniref:alpha/beta hydrolase n=1 Tax=Pseudonocardia sp. NPDC049154 TaxID=3155501 RepID=UPI0033F320CF